MAKKKVLVVVAHPDDETIWMGGTILRNKDKWDLTIISLCRRDDRDRAPKFFKVCEEYGAKGYMSDLDDEKMNPVDINDVVKKILEFSERRYDQVYTHGENGEYGHLRHLDVHKAVCKIIDDKMIITNNLFFFSYVKKECSGTDTGFDSYVDKNADNFIKLNEIEFLMKKKLVKNLYGFPKGGFEERNSRDTEAFDLYKKGL